jgi:hypothetical protein
MEIVQKTFSGCNTQLLLELLDVTYFSDMQMEA